VFDQNLCPFAQHECYRQIRWRLPTDLVAAGVDVKSAQTRLGHSSLSVTLAIYARATTEADRRARAFKFCHGK
jgi:site-specific recombinase XerD